VFLPYVDIIICVGSHLILLTWPSIYRGQEGTMWDRLKASQVHPSRRPNCCPPLLSLATAHRRSSAAEILHHKHHTVMLLIQYISPPYLLDQGGRRHRCAVRVHRSEAPPVVALGSDRIARRRRLVRLHHPCSVEHFRCVISSRV
jgi:hypothetical protein